MRYFSAMWRQAIDSSSRWQTVSTVIGSALLILAAQIVYLLTGLRLLPSAFKPSDLGGLITSGLLYWVVLTFLLVFFVVTPMRAWYANQGEILKFQADQAELSKLRRQAEHWGEFHGLSLSPAPAPAPAPASAPRPTPQAVPALGPASGQAEIGVEAWKTDTLIRDREVRLWEMPLEEGGIHGRIFEGCTIIGPAIIAPVGSDFLYSTFQGAGLDSIFWEVPPGRPIVVGVIGVRNCTFRRCVFAGIGIAGPRELIEKFRGGIREG
jgi:hypothetical protein